ncbi:hypothetical protein [Mycolicibacterium fortuitum]|uniref:hypothetical protein n=1 Tax=Mycolicibacterium fortuitum TaxID=1766 RepID=UPI0007EC154B|nr:hypothetical protein [Mycolicibacterium fortuitum]OBB35258.1 hypothetical protein A5763_00420 [Mycolicibacterium fortuitum]OBB41709.1 hypothetical protein A5754_16735 [Mycolicibacterium fortuitum]OBB63172.1 hypothetical protein A5755_21915 [Mycolicibacterium fortuitum]OBF87194.1 hypothetical protein A5751_07510 [Mycolicibacterium fortuitum]
MTQLELQQACEELLVRLDEHPMSGWPADLINIVIRLIDLLYGAPQAKPLPPDLKIVTGGAS